MTKTEEKTKQKQGGSGVGDTMKITWNVGSVNDKKRYYGEVNISKTADWCNGREAGRVDCYTRKGLRSSSSLKVIAIQL